MAKAFGTSILLLDQTSTAGVDRFRSHRLTNVAADKHFWIARYARIVRCVAAELRR